MTRTAARLGLTLGAMIVCASSAIAQDYPNRPIRVIAPFAAGGPVDLFARIYANALSARIGQNVIVENRAGAGGVLGVDHVAKSAKDGYTLVMSGPGALVASPYLSPKFPFDVLADLQPITMAVKLPTIIVAHPQAGAKNLRDLITQARANAGKLAYASAGSGTLTHLAAELFKIDHNIDMVHVPYKGAAPAMVDLTAGRVQAMFPDLPPAVPHVRSGALVGLAVASDRRWPALPDVPTTAEAGVPNFVVESVYGVLAPSGLPADVLTKLNQASVVALSAADTAEQIRKQGAEPAPTTPQAYRDWIADEQKKWSRVIKQTGIKLD